MKQRILITGGLGYVGGRLAVDLSTDPNYEVIVTTRSIAPPQTSWLPQGKVMSLDLLNRQDCDRICEGIDTVIHLAALNEIDSGKDPDKALLVTGLGSLNLLKAAEQAKVKQFIYFSTAHIYRAPLVGNITENDVPRPAHPYSITHKTAEDFILAEGDRSSLRTLVLRLSNGIGAPTHPDVNRWTLVGNDLCRQAVTEKALTLRSSGLQWRDFITLRDVGEAVKHLLQPEIDWGNGIFNLGGEMPLRIIDIAQLIQQRCEITLGFTPKLIRPAPKPEEKYQNLHYSIDKLKHTGFILHGNLTEEIDATLHLCQKKWDQ
ncbi:NAD-dependent epimerase/dehydratase family protein [Crocosphaera sp. Alani8]|uniref:NAD-dependent epimerase/dehydratase family protein n=1 Tax=Crocosphaera sp. Alani8 TaxID=3038952 RepID=UPI00313C6BF4